MRKILVLLAIIMATTSLRLSAQEGQVTGKVTEEGGQPVPRATVLVKGTSTSAFTNEEGSFTINLPPGRNILVISSVGFETIEEKVSGNNITITLKKQNTDLNEVVVVGYGQTDKKRNNRFYQQSELAVIEKQARAKL